jgi:hypothetical protein
MSRKSQQADLIFKLGQLFGPILKVLDNPTGYDEDEKTRIFARYCSEYMAFQNEAEKFCSSEKGHHYLKQFQEIVGRIHSVFSNLPLLQSDFALFSTSVRTWAREIQEIVLSIPVPVDSAIYEAHTPFSTYCLVKDLCSTAKREIIWLDRYFDQGIFHRYFPDVPRNVLITLVTWPQSECKGARDNQRYQEFMDVSKLFAQERGQSGYRLITNLNFHDRWLCCDDKLFTLGGSIKDIGNASTFTLSRLDSTPENRKHFDDAIATGVEVFGPNQPNHP